MEKKSFVTDFLLGYNPEISTRSLISDYYKLSKVIGGFDRIEVGVSRLGREAFQVKIVIIGAANSPRRLVNTVSGLIGDVLHLSNETKIRLVKFSCPVVEFSASEADAYLTIEFFK